MALTRHADNPKTDPEILAFFTPDAVQICESEAPVSEWPIRMWCRATGDNNPVYQDREAARRYGHRDVFAPPGMMHAFTMPGLLDPAHDHLLEPPAAEAGGIRAQFYCHGQV